ncbi:epoxide hydrolase N-terminal domain-containing protein [Streptomyces mexicanus]|uniref:epoxide hydrolase N-terminal domain-containing protein n=1 Tax=Streptomyces mexicanus TaxID=178566 RepID=UPI0036968AA8
MALALGGGAHRDERPGFPDNRAMTTPDATAERCRSGGRHDGTTPHCVHTWPPYQNAVPLLMVHGWPLPHVRMCGIPLLTQPETSRSSLQLSPASTSAARTRPCPRH